MIKLYYSPGACSLASHIVLEELGIAYEPVLVSLKDGEHKKADFLKINPKARVPALNVDGKVLTENVAILTYLGGGYAERGLWPKETWKQAEALSLMAWLASSVHIAFAGIFRPERFCTDVPAHAAIGATSRATIEKYFADIDKLLTGRTFAMGGQYTVCDPYLLVFYRWGNRIGLPMKERFPVWAKHAQRVASRPTVKRILEAEGIQIDG
ncbi:MAG: glutathione S-transferase N-terminal domain-containing protein [Betaproteobacteria bacterium]|nr:glutathione S-transferase N-terminal domain-containing protein [Betaproteobacteria bacterium]